MQGARHGFINGKQDVKASHNILFNRSIVHAIRLNVSEALFSGVVSAHTQCVCVCVCMCAAPECRQCSSRMY